MLNITTRISISRESRNHIRALKVRQNGHFTQASWGMIRNSVKSEISGRLLFNQSLKCVYCERYVYSLSPEIDHFAHKALYPEFTFIPINLFYACKLCNSTSRKGQKPTIVNRMNQYNQCTFSIVHPFFDNPDIEIRFLDADRIYFDRTNSSPVGNATIDFFEWEDLIYSTIRSRDLVLQRLNPLTSDQERQLIHETIAYR